MLSSILAGAILGLAAGLTPGPLLTLVVLQTLRHGPREGVFVAAAPILTDIPIILSVLLVLREVGPYGVFLGILSLCGGCYVLWLAWETWRAGPVDAGTEVGEARSLRKGALINLLNPHPWLFWITVGAPLVFRAGQEGQAGPWFFIGFFYISLVGSKVAVALTIGKFRTFFAGRAYRILMAVLAAVLAGFALFLFREACRWLNA